MLLLSMQFIQGNNRHQTFFTTPGDQVSADNAVRLMDAFIDKLDLLSWLVYFPLSEAFFFRGPVSPTVTSTKSFAFTFISKIIHFATGR